MTKRVDEGDGHWLLPTNGHLVTQWRFYHALTLVTAADAGTTFEFRLRTDFVVLRDGRRAPSTPEASPGRWHRH